MGEVVSYLGCSTLEQRLGDSDRRQIAAGQKWAAENGLIYVGTLRDIGVSAFRGKNRAMGALRGFLDAVAAGRWPKDRFLYVENFDRLSREEPLEAFDLFRSIVRGGVPLCVRGDLYTQEVIRREPGRLFAILAELQRAHSESRIKGERVAESYVSRREKARERLTPITGKKCPAWLSFEGDHYEIIPERAAIVRRIFQLAADGNGVQRIARVLNADGIAPFGRSKHGWQSGYVYRVLQSPAIRGEFQPHRVIEGQRVADGARLALFPPLVPNPISEALYHCAGRALESRLHRGAPREDTGFRNLLKGVLRCDVCGGPVIWTDATPRNAPRRYEYLRCSAATLGGCENRTGFPYDRVEANLLGLFDVRREMAKLIPAASDTTEAEIAELSGLAERRKASRARLFEEMAEFTGSAREAAKAEIARLTGKIDRAEADLRERRARQHTSPADEHERIEQARAAIEAEDPERRFAARMKFNQILRDTFSGRLTADRHVIIEHSYPAGYRVEYVLSPQTILRARAVCHETDKEIVIESGAEQLGRAVLAIVNQVADLTRDDFRDRPSPAETDK